jgi:hypothetical protein
MTFIRRLALSAASLLMLTGVVAAGPAAARGGGTFRTTDGSALVTEAAKQLGVDRSKLSKAIVDAANTRIDQAVEDEDVSSTDAADLKDEVADSVRYAMSVSQTRVVASNLGITSAALNTGFRAARKAIITARIDAAVTDGDLDATEAADQKAQLEKVTLAGYKQSGLVDLGTDVQGGSGADRGGHGGGCDRGGSGSSTGSSSGSDSGSTGGTTTGSDT